MSIALKIPITYFKGRDVNAYYEHLKLYATARTFYYF